MKVVTWTLFFICIAGLTLAQELTLNLGFEVSYPVSYFKHWWVPGLNQSNYAVVLDTTTAHTGNKSLCITFKERRNPHQRSASFYQSVPNAFNYLKGKDTVTISAYVKINTPDNSSNATIYVSIKGGGKFKYQLGKTHLHSTPVGEWHKQTVTIPIGTTDSTLLFGGFLAGPGIAWFDDFEISVDGVRFKDVASPMPPVSISELRAIQNKLVTLGMQNDKFVVGEKFYKSIKKSKVIGLGEGTHGTHEFSILKNRIIQQLAENENGKIIVAFESSFGAALSLNDYVVSGKGDATELIKRFISNPWRSNECLELVQWIRSFNEKHENKILFLGFDNQWPTAEVKRLKEFASKYNHDLLQKIDQLENLGHHFNSLIIDAAASDSIDRQLQAISADLSYANRQSVPLGPYRIAQRNVEVLKQYFARQRQGIGPNTSIFRDSCLAQNIMWIAENFPKRKIIVWAHNAHIEKTVKRMGGWLRTYFKDDYIAVGFSTSRGTYTSFDSGAKVSLLQEPHPETYEYWFDRMDPESWILFIKDLTDDPETRWMQRPLFLRYIGSSESDFQFMRANILLDYDCIIHFRNTSHISHLYSR